MDAQIAFKRIYISSWMFAVFWIVFQLVYFLMTLPLFSMRLGDFFWILLYPTILSVPEYIMLLSSLQVWTLGIDNFTIGIWGSMGFMVLFRTNIIFELILTTLVLAPLLSFAFTLSFSYILLPLVKDAKFSEGGFRLWNLPPSDRYRTYGEAKNRIKDLIRNGSLKEKTGICLGFASPFLLLVYFGILSLFMFSHYFSMDFLLNLTLFMLLLTALFITSYWFMRSTIR